MVNLFLALTQTEIIILVVVSSLVALAVLLFILLLVARRKNKRLNGEKKVDKVKIVNGVRYTVGDAVTDGSEVKVSLIKNDIILKRGEEVTVRKGGTVIPGKYSILAADDINTTFNIRVGDYVREFTHNTPIVLDEGEKICPVSHTVILR